MSIAIVIIALIGYILIATEHITHINKAAVAMFLGVVGWILFMIAGRQVLSPDYALDYTLFLGGEAHTPALLREYITSEIFMKYVSSACEVVFFLMATISIVEVLNANGCFDFIIDWMRTRNSKLLLWKLSAFTFLLSANLDNLTSAVMMLTIMHQIVTDSRQRMFYGSAIVIAANCGGTFTVIGDISTLLLWVKGAVTPSNFSASLFLPSLVAMVVPVILISRKLPERIQIDVPRFKFRGDDNALSTWLRSLLLFIGIGGLWFIPTFHNLTALPPFVGALCVLSVFWVVNEWTNRKLICSEQPLPRGIYPRVFQYENYQKLLFFIGLSLAVGVIQETGVFEIGAKWCDHNIHSIYILSVLFGLFSAVLDNLVLVLSSISMYDVTSVAQGLDNYGQAFLLNSSYWHIIAYSAGIGGCLLSIGSTAGYALMKSENVTIWWYVRYISGKTLVGWLCGLIVYFACDKLF